MPVLSRFHGITIRMYFQQSEHNPTHIHAIYKDYMAAVAIQNGEVLEGKLPSHTLLLVHNWISIHENELLKMWETQEFRKLEPLK